jgi:hypothetical protein
MPHLDAWAAAHPQIKVLGVHAGSSPGEVGPFVTDKGWRHIVFLVDATEQAVAAYRVDTYPTVFGIAPDGTITAVQVGTASSAWLEAVAASAKLPGP